MLHAEFQIIHVSLLRYATIEGAVSKNLLQAIQHVVNVCGIGRFEEVFKLLKHTLIGIGGMEIRKEPTCITYGAASNLLFSTNEISQFYAKWGDNGVIMR